MYLPREIIMQVGSIFIVFKILFLLCVFISIFLQYIMITFIVGRSYICVTHLNSFSVSFPSSLSLLLSKFDHLPI